MHVTVETEDDIRIVSASDKIDASTAPELEEVVLGLMNKGILRIVLDLRQVSYLSSAGLRVILMVAQQLYGRGKVAIAGPQDEIREILEMTGFDTVMPIETELESALRAVQSMDR